MDLHGTRQVRRGADRVRQRHADVVGMDARLQLRPLGSSQRGLARGPRDGGAPEDWICIARRPRVHLSRHRCGRPSIHLASTGLRRERFLVASNEGGTTVRFVSKGASLPRRFEMRAPRIEKPRVFREMRIAPKKMTGFARALRFSSCDSEDTHVAGLYTHSDMLC